MGMTFLKISLRIPDDVGLEALHVVNYLPLDTRQGTNKM